MADDAPTVKVDDFKGLVNNIDSRDIPAGAGQKQLNATCVKSGQLQVRQGLRELTFDNAEN